MDLERTLRTLWAKSAQRDEPAHLLLAHLLDVAACTEAILAFEPPRTRALIAADFGLDERGAVRWTAALAGLHDLGKASPAFQKKSPPEWKRVAALGLTAIGADERCPHGVISDELLRSLLKEHGWRPAATQHAANAVGAHHGYRATEGDVDGVRERDQGVGVWRRVQTLLVQRVLDVLEVPAAPTPTELSGAAFQRLAGLTSFADWIGSSLPRMPLGNDDRAYYRGARERAAAKLDEIGWQSWRERELPVPAFEAMFAHLGTPAAPFSARQLQRVMAELVTGVSGDEPLLLIVEAPMGEGKTEAALYAYEVLRDRIGHRGLYLALPTQATSNQMFERVRTHLERSGYADAPDLQLLHGGKDLNDTFEAMKVRPNDLDDAGDRALAVAARVWFTNRKRALLSEHGAGTVDQALMSVLPVGHQFVRMWGLGNRVVVLDEVHAYDTYTSALIATMLRWLRALGSSVVLMSATLPASARAQLAEAFGANEIDVASYPRITAVEGERVVHRSFAAESGRGRKPLRIEAMGVGIEAVAARALELAGQGGCVACIVNTVRRAQTLAQRLRGALAAERGEITIFHARFPADQRGRLEDEVVGRFGRDGERPRRAILVATQVVEQSLDLDFDAMITDLAPVDLLLQRAGRMHRHERAERHGHDEPLLVVAGLAAEGELPDLSTEYFDRVYEPYVLLRTWLALRERERVRFPEEIDALVQEVYEGEVIGGMSEAVSAALGSARKVLERRRERESASAVNAVIGRPDDGSWERVPDRTWSDEDGEMSARAAVTRLGEPSITVVPVYRRGGEFFLDAAGTQPATIGGGRDTAGARRVFGRVIRISRPEIYHALKEGEPLAGWEAHPLTRYLKALVLEEGGAVFGKLRVSLHGWLGLIYE